MTEINTHDAVIEFGKHSGQRVTRLPVSYLKWAIVGNVSRPTTTKSGTYPFFQVAMAEIKRRGERMSDIDVSAHAIDRLSLRYRKVWHETAVKEEGLHSWAQRIAKEAWETRTDEMKQDENVYVIKYQGIQWVIEEFVIPVVKTVK